MPRFVYQKANVSIDRTATSLLKKYRPQTFNTVLGHAAAVRSLEAAIKNKRSHAFMFTGRSGVGKTTLAYITVAALGCDPDNLVEVDAATHSGVDDMRSVTGGLLYHPLGGSAKAIIVDECHKLSDSAWNSLLKKVEDPPEFAYWVFCTTEPTKVPDTIRSRCLHYDLKPIGYLILVGLVSAVAELEHMNLADGIAGLCAKEAEGSARQALANLGKCADAKSQAEAAELLRS
jgi:DNA polymerase-3 subunit gamma/tau